MEALRKPIRFGETTPLELQIHLGKMEREQGSLGLEASTVLGRMQEMSAKLNGKIDGLETPEKIREVTRLRPIMDNFPASKEILLSM